MVETAWSVQFGPNNTREHAFFATFPIGFKEKSTIFRKQSCMAHVVMLNQKP